MGLVRGGDTVFSLEWMYWFSVFHCREIIGVGCFECKTTEEHEAANQIIYPVRR